jgi:heterodisulfide reductase subunit B
MGMDFVTPCSGCYKNAYFTNKYLKEDPELAEHINYALEADNLHIDGSTDIRHLIEIYIEDVGFDAIKGRCSHPLSGLRVAPYYGCQLLRPKKDSEDVENPQFFEKLLSAMGADPVIFGSKTRCCGGSLIMTNRMAALDMVHILLQDAENCEADVISTCCPLCNLNLELYQKQVNHEFGTKYSIPVMYFTQLLGLALGISPEKLGIDKELVSPAPISAFF